MQEVDEFKEFFEDSHTPESIELLLAMEGTYCEVGYTWTLNDIWEWVLEHGVLYNRPKMGWIDRRGKIYGCGPSTHDKIIHDVLKRTVAEIEDEGWVRVGLYGRTRCKKKMTQAQGRSLDKMLLLWEEINNRKP